mgnify:CR=1 FL=1|jgi:predicted Zn-dependent peptidase
MWCDGAVSASQARVDYPVHTRQLSNGLVVVVSPDHSVPIVAVNLWYDVGSRDERPGQAGWAHLFEHLMFQGSANVASGEHLNALQNVGGSVNATTSFDRTNYFETVPVGALDLALWMEADRLATLADHLDEANLDTQREVVKEEKRQRYDNVPYGHVMPQLLELLFPAGHPYAHSTIGSMADLDAATPETAQAFFARHYRADNAVLTLVGDISPKEGFKKAERYFGWIPGWNRRQRPAAAALPALAEPQRHDVWSAVPADAVYLAWRLPERDTTPFDAADLALAVLGQGQASRLHLGLVRGRQVAAGASAAGLGLIGGNSVGYAMARGLPTVGTAALEAALREEVARLANEGPSEAEVDRAKVQYSREWLSELSQFDARADELSAFATLHRDPERVNRRLLEIMRLGVDDVAAAASAWLAADSAASLCYHQEVTDAST